MPAMICAPRLRRGLASGMAACVLASSASALTGFDAARDWQGFCQRFVTAEGRVVDHGQGGISHSEGQGYGLLMAVQADDRAGFERIAAWTFRELGTPGRGLHAWRYDPRRPRPVDDPNNATDGDLAIAWAMLRGARRWQAPALMQRAATIAGAVLRDCLDEWAGLPVLLPGAYGFAGRDRVTVNPSYYLFPALRDFAAAMPDPRWARLHQAGLEVLRRGRFGRWGLTADWLDLPRMATRPALAQGRPGRFSYDALRVPLYLAWDGLGQEAALGAAVAFWLDPACPDTPAWTDLRTDALAPYPASDGVRAVAALATAAVMGRGRRSALPSPQRAEGYYDAALCFLAQIAWEESGIGGWMAGLARPVA